jgi:hypothetical protein
MKQEREEYVLTEKAYWTGPGAAVRVMTGLSWFVLGITFAILVNAIFY